MIEPARLTAARVAGLLYLVTNVTAILAFSTRIRLIAAGDAAQTARNIAASEHLFRASIVTELLTIVGVIGLVVALYVVLEPVGEMVLMVFPHLAAVVKMFYMGPMGVFEISIGIWLLVKGVRS